MNATEQSLEQTKASIRAKVEHPFRTIKRQFGYDKVRYRELEKNSNRLATVSAFTNLFNLQKDAARIGQVRLDFATWRNQGEKKAN